MKRELREIKEQSKSSASALALLLMRFPPQTLQWQWQSSSGWMQNNHVYRNHHSESSNHIFTMFDYDHGSRYATCHNPPPSWFKLDFGTVMWIDSIEVTFWGGGYSARAMTIFLGTASSGPWTIVWQGSPGNHAVAQLLGFQATTARWVYFDITETYNAGQSNDCFAIRKLRARIAAA